MKKEVNVVMLPTDKADIILINGALKYSNGEQRNKFAENKPQHLYFTNDDEIKVDDWFIRDSFPHGPFKSIGIMVAKDAKKIIATTNPELLSKQVATNYSNNLQDWDGKVHWTKGAFKIPQSFIEEYVKSEVKIDKVMLEYARKSFNLKDKTLYPIITRNGEVIISSNVTKKTYTREEVYRFLADYGADVLVASNNKEPIPYYMDWFNKNYM